MSRAGRAGHVLTDATRTSITARTVRAKPSVSYSVSAPGKRRLSTARLGQLLGNGHHLI